MLNLSRWNLASYALMTAQQTKGTNNDVAPLTPSSPSSTSSKGSQPSPSTAPSQKGTQAVSPNPSAQRKGVF